MGQIPVMNIIFDSIVDGEGMRAVVFVAGCPHCCRGCHNPKSWKAKNGTMISIEEIYELLVSNPINDVTFSGGEPFLYANELAQLAVMLKEEGKNIWAWSGYTYEEIIACPSKEKLLKEIDVLVDGKFILEQKDLSLYWKGSKNQRVLKLKDGKIIEIFDDNLKEWSEYNG